MCSFPSAWRWPTRCLFILVRCSSLAIKVVENPCGFQLCRWRASQTEVFLSSSWIRLDYMINLLMSLLYLRLCREYQQALRCIWSLFMILHKDQRKAESLFPITEWRDQATEEWKRIFHVTQKLYTKKMVWEKYISSICLQDHLRAKTQQVKLWVSICGSWKWWV